MIDDETNYIQIDSEPFSDVLCEVVDHTTEDIGIGTISVTTASEATEDGSLITLKFLEGNDEITVEEVDGNVKENVGLDDITALT
jgi:hypothetical protein